MPPDEIRRFDGMFGVKQQNFTFLPISQKKIPSAYCPSSLNERDLRLHQQIFVKTKNLIFILHSTQEDIVKNLPPLSLNPNLFDATCTLVKAEVLCEVVNPT
jgi:hypothetical protein